MAPIQDDIYELHLSEVKSYASSQKSYQVYTLRKVLLTESYNFPVKQVACPMSFVTDLATLGPLSVILMRKDALLVQLQVLSQLFNLLD